MTTQFRLGDGVSRDAIEDACGELGFRLSNVVARAAIHPAQAIFLSADRLTLLHLIEDEVAGRAVVLRGANAEELTAKMLRALAGDAPRPAPRAADGGSP
jgi:hypothetical protein